MRLGGPDNRVEYTDELKPTLFFLPGGGWQSGDKISRSLFLMPYVEKGFVVVTANYRHIPDTGLPAIIGDTRAALNWIYENSAKYKMDTNKIVISGESAGGHLALIGVIDNETLFPQEEKKIERKMKVTAIVNWFGVADLNLANTHWDQNRAKEVFFGGGQIESQENIDALLQKCSPVSYLDTQIPPKISIHGNEDVSARYEQSVLLHEKLEQLGIKNTFITIPGKKHGNFSPEEMTLATKEVWNFLEEAGILVK